MKISMLIVLFALSTLFVLKVDGADEKYVEATFSPRTKLFDSRGNAEYMAKEQQSNRVLRNPSACRIPNSLEDSELKCKLFPSKVECNQTCIFGHTFPEGIQRHMKCKYEEDKWYPSADFEQCKPFVDCTLTYGPGAYAKCYTNFMDKGPSCEVRCEHYEDKEAVPSSMYQCDIEGKWTPKLPFCVKAGSGVKLAYHPRGRKM